MASKIPEDRSKCPICFDVYKEPKALVCLHTFCEACIHEYIIKSKEKGLLSDGIECPLCRFVTHVEKDRPPEIWTKSLRPNFALASLLETVSSSHKFSEEDQNFCQPCSNQNATTSETTFCSVCNEMMCDECKKVHDSLQITKNHDSINIDSKQNVEFLTSFKTLQRCEMHDKKVKFYCREEDKLCCSTCAIIAHRECKGLVELTEIAKEKYPFVQRSVLAKQISELENTMKISSAHFVSEGKKLTSQAIGLMNNLKELREKVIQRFDELEDTLKDDLKEIQTSKSSEIMMNAVGCDEIACEMHRLLHILELANGNGTEEQIFVVVKRLNDEFSRHRCKAAMNFTVVENLNLSLNVLRAMENFLDKSTDIMEISVETKEKVISSCAAKKIF